MKWTVSIMSSLFDKALIKEQMKRYWALGVLTFLAFLLFVLMPLWKTSNPAHSVVEILSLRNAIILIVNIITPLAAASVMFSHMYKPSAAVAFYSMPFSKKKIFASNVFAGFLLIAIPLFILSLLLLVFRVENDFTWFSTGMGLKEIPYGNVINTFTNVTMFFLRTLISFVFYYVLFITAAMIAGNQIMHLIVSLFLAFAVVIVKFGFDIGASFFIFGYYADMSPYEKIHLYTNPVLIGTVDGYVSNSAHASYYVVYAVSIVVLIILSAWLHQKRRLECTADMIVFSPIKQFLVFIISVTGMICMGVLFRMFFMGGMAVVYAGFIAGFILAFYIAQMIIEKSFNVLYRMKWVIVHGLAVLAVMALFSAINVFNIGGYVKYVPKAEEVSGVNLSHFNNIMMYDADSMALKEMFIQDQYIIEKTIAAHEKIIDNRRDLSKVFVGYFIGRNHNDIRILYITYMLKNGSIVTREYVLSNDIFEESGIKGLLD